MGEDRGANRETLADAERVVQAAEKALTRLLLSTRGVGGEGIVGERTKLAN